MLKHCPYQRTPYKIYICENKTTKSNNIEKLSTEIGNSNLMDKIDMSPTAGRNGNYNIINTIIGNAMEKHIPEIVIKFNNPKHK